MNPIFLWRTRLRRMSPRVAQRITHGNERGFNRRVQTSDPALADVIFVKKSQGRFCPDKILKSQNCPSSWNAWFLRLYAFGFGARYILGFDTLRHRRNAASLYLIFRNSFSCSVYVNFLPLQKGQVITIFSVFFY